MPQSRRVRATEVLKGQKGFIFGLAETIKNQMQRAEKRVLH